MEFEVVAGCSRTLAAGNAEYPTLCELMPLQPASAAATRMQKEKLSRLMTRPFVPRRRGLPPRFPQTAKNEPSDSLPLESPVSPSTLIHRAVPYPPAQHVVILRGGAPHFVTQ